MIGFTPHTMPGLPPFPCPHVPALIKRLFLSPFLQRVTGPEMSVAQCFHWVDIVPSLEIFRGPGVAVVLEGAGEYYLAVRTVYFGC